ncbi:AP-5 complex subunit zeta-1-like [Acropora millepora]|uniref:AP-5 complex subunit zeta-1-like n=1 Tax=Acropora millepora TaxID=45264 RepID=UPI001CF52442|nr:AP-5 complex subunit zeta-1-like [Acropora millepora]
MAERTSDPSTVLKQARLLQEPDFKEFCTKVTKNLQSRDRGSECVNNLRRLFLLLAATRQRRSLSTELINELKKVACEPQQGPKRLRLLCATILQEIIPTSELIIDNVEPPIEEKWIPVIFPLVWVQGQERGYWSKHVPQLIQWLSKPGIPVELQLMSLGSLKLLIYVDETFTSQDDVGKVSSLMANWLKNASTFSAPNPYQRQLLRGGKTRGSQLVEEVDGTSSRYFFTVLSIAQYCFPDQFLNIHSFSMLRPWLQQPGFTSQIVPSGSPRSPRSPMVSVPVSNSGSMENISESPHLSTSTFPSTLSQSQSTFDNMSISSHSSASYVVPVLQSSPLEPGIQSPVVSENADRDSISSDGGSRPQTPLSFPLDPEEIATKSQAYSAAKRVKHKRSHSNLSFSKLFPPSGQGVKSGQQELKERACEYCLRLLEQSERKPGKQQDAILIEACLVEAIYILDTLCSSDKSLIPKLIEIIRRLYTRVTSDINKWKRVLIPVVQFFLNHGETVVFDPEPACKTLFGPVLSSYYCHSSLAFDIIFFSLENLEKLSYSTSVLSKYFPNILKILAWYPRTYLKEFMDLLPAMLNEDTIVEVFHALLDLPCLAAALCTSSVKANSGDKMIFGQQSSAEAFWSPEHRSLYSFILRPEAGHGDTIDKLATLHSLLEDTLEQPRVVVSAQIVPVLLNVMFATVLEQAEEETVSRLVPVILERVGLLYPVQHYQREIHELLSQRLVQLCQKYPNLIIRFQQDIMDFVTGLKNLGPTKENFFVHLVWIIGEFASSAHDSGCTVQNIVHYFEAFEALTYEVIMQTAPGKVTFSGRLLSVLMTTLAKLASRCQDLIQRAILCLSKIVRQKPVLLCDPECYPDVLMRAQELINLLKLPNVAPVILSPDVEVYSGRWHRDSNSSLPLLLRTCDTILAS